MNTTNKYGKYKTLLDLRSFRQNDVVHICTLE